MSSALARRLVSTLFVLALILPVSGGETEQPAGSAAGVDRGVLGEADLAGRLAAIETTIERERRKRHVPGVALVIVKDGRVLTMRGFGVRDVERQLPVTADTLFAIGSCTKMFTAMTVMQSVDDGKLSLDDSPKKYLPYFRLSDPEADQKITIADLLCHRSGLDRTDLAWFTGVLRPDEVIRVAGCARPAARFRERFLYQNVMYLAAGEVVGKVERMPWRKVVAQRIFQPLGMKSANSSLVEMRRAPDHALGYTYDEGTKRTTPMPMRDLWNVAPAGAINASARDMAQFLRLMLDGGVVSSVGQGRRADGVGRRLISEEGLAALITPHMKMAPNVDYGYGWRLGAWNGHRLAEHGGSTDGFDAEVAFMPDEKLGVVLLSNLHFSSLRWVALEAVWKHLVGLPETPAGPAASASAAPTTATAPEPKPTEFVAPLSVDALMQRVIEAAGGEANLRRHRTWVSKVKLDVESHGLTGKSVLYSRAPNARAEIVKLYGLGRKIATMRAYFDGTRGGCETSFTAPSVHTGKELVDARVAAEFYPELNWRTLFQSVTITGVAKVGDEEVYVVEKRPTEGSPVTDYISTKTFLLLKRDSNAFAPESNGSRLLTELFSEYRAVDGVMVPFRRVQTIGWRGSTIVTVEDVRFNARVPESVFRPGKPAAGR